jgi:hypothetical protein
MTEKHLHQQIGDAIIQCKKRLFKRLKEGAELETAIAQFIGELRLALDSIVMNP